MALPMPRLAPVTNAVFCSGTVQSVSGLAGEWILAKRPGPGAAAPTTLRLHHQRHVDVPPVRPPLAGLLPPAQGRRKIGAEHAVYPTALHRDLITTSGDLERLGKLVQVIQRVTHGVVGEVIGRDEVADLDG